MVISNEQWKKLTESKFWKPTLGKEHRVVFNNWRCEERVFKDQKESRLVFVADVIVVDGIPCAPKEFTTSDMNLCKMFMYAVGFAEKNGKDKLNVMMHKMSDRQYNFVDLNFVDQAVYGGA